jgi:hypothetical protein
MKTTDAQKQSLLSLMERISKFDSIGSVKNLMVMLHSAMPNEVIIRYDKEYMAGGVPVNELKIVGVNQFGQVTEMDTKFKDVYERYGFLGDCSVVDINTLL